MSAIDLLHLNQDRYQRDKLRRSQLPDASVYRFVNAVGSLPNVQTRGATFSAGQQVSNGAIAFDEECGVIRTPQGNSAVFGQMWQEDEARRAIAPEAYQLLFVWQARKFLLSRPNPFNFYDTYLAINGYRFLPGLHYRNFEGSPASGWRTITQEKQVSLMVVCQASVGGVLGDESPTRYSVKRIDIAPGFISEPYDDPLYPVTVVPFPGDQPPWVIELIAQRATEFPGEVLFQRISPEVIRGDSAVEIGINNYNDRRLYLPPQEPEFGEFAFAFTNQVYGFQAGEASILRILDLGRDPATLLERPNFQKLYSIRVSGIVPESPAPPYTGFGSSQFAAVYAY